MAAEPIRRERAMRPRQALSRPVYNLFRRKKEPDLYVALLQGATMPPFLHEEQWEFGGRAGPAAAPLGFDARAAREGMRLNGFYLFLRAA